MRHGRIAIVSLLAGIALVAGAWWHGRTSGSIPLLHHRPGPVRSPAAPARPEDTAALVAAETRFALGLYRQLAVAPGDLVIGPRTVAASLALVQAGAAGQTRQEIDAAMGWEPLGDRLHPAMAVLDRSLAGVEGIRFRMADRVWLAPIAGCWPDFVGLCRDYHGGEPGMIAFAPPEPARREINAWIGRQTDGRIPEAIAVGGLRPDTRLVVASACAFLGRWKVRFRPGATEVGAPFHRPGGDRTCALMHVWHSFDYAEDARVQVVAVPYGPEEGASGGHLLLVLPRTADGLARVETELTPERLAAWDRQLGQQEVDLALPRFTASLAVPLEGALSGLGIRRAFDPLRADLSGMAEEPLHLDQVLHRAWIRTDEGGSEAAAATVSPVAAAPIMPGEGPKEVRADRPFLYLIRERSTASILFLGRVTDPVDPGAADRP